MKNAYELLQEKEIDLARVRREIESLRIVAPLLSDDLTVEEPNNFEESTKKPARSAEETPNSEPEKATGTEGLFSSINPNRRSRFWNI